MALVIVSGYPCSGRTTRSEELRIELEKRITQNNTSIRRVVVISDATAHNRRSCYNNQRSEKPARAAYLSAVTRVLSPDTIVLADGGAGLNIKGFRYQLWCAAREEQVRCVSVQVHAPPAKVHEWNEARRQAGQDAYEPQTMDELLTRYEEPNNMTRWDQPLYVISSVPVLIPGTTDTDSLPEPVPADAIWSSITEGTAAPAPGVVAKQTPTAGNYLTLLEGATQAVVAALIEHANTIGLPPAGGQVRLPVSLGESQEVVQVDVPAQTRPLSLPALQRHRRTFVRMHSTGMASVNILGDTAREEAKDEAAGQREIARRFAAWLGQALQSA